MGLWIFLDTGPLGILTNPKRPLLTIEMLRWATIQVRLGNRLMVPAIADYEVRRELIRLGKTASITALDEWNRVTTSRYLPLTDTSIKRAANLWAEVRNQGLVTADPKELDCDALIAAQTLEFGEVQELSDEGIVVATLNVGHLARFVPAKLWSEI